MNKQRQQRHDKGRRKTREGSLEPPSLDNSSEDDAKEWRVKTRKIPLVEVDVKPKQQQQQQQMRSMEDDGIPMGPHEEHCRCVMCNEARRHVAKYRQPVPPPTEKVDHAVPPKKRDRKEEEEEDEGKDEPKRRKIVTPSEMKKPEKEEGGCLDAYERGVLETLNEEKDEPKRRKIVTPSETKTKKVVGKEAEEEEEGDEYVDSYRPSALETLKEAIRFIGTHSKDIVSIEEKNSFCEQMHPCQGHGPAIVTFRNGYRLRIPCDSVDMGALMWYFNKGTDHFTDYIDDKFKDFLCQGLGVRNVLGLPPSLNPKPDVVVPDRFNVLRDIDLLDRTRQMAPITPTLPVEKMTEKNYKWMTASKFAITRTGFADAARSYACDLCHQRTSSANPIYTNAKHTGVDLCTQCVELAFRTTLQPEPAWYPRAYKLSAIVAAYEGTQ